MGILLSGVADTNIFLDSNGAATIVCPPTSQPIRQPSTPTSQPTSQPPNQPTDQPTSEPTYILGTSEASLVSLVTKLCCLVVLLIVNHMKIRIYIVTLSFIVCFINLIFVCWNYLLLYVHTFRYIDY